MRGYLLLLVVLSGGYSFSQAAAEAGLANGLGAGMSAGASTRLGSSLDQAFGRASQQVHGSQMIVVPAERRRSSRPPSAQRTKKTADSKMVAGNATKPAISGVPQTQANPPRKKSWEISTKR